MTLLASPALRPGPNHYRIAHLLHAHGPTPAAALADALGLDPADVRELTIHPWFRNTSTGWVLTPRGRSRAITARAG